MATKATTPARTKRRRNDREAVEVRLEGGHAHLLAAAPAHRCAPVEGKRQRLGQFQTIAIGPAGEVYDGHQRLSVLKAAHGPRFQVQALQADRALTEKEREELTVAAHVGTTGQFDWDELSGWDTTDLQTWGFDAELLQDWNTDAAALATMLESAQDAPPEDPGPQIDRAEEPAPYAEIEGHEAILSLVALGSGVGVVPRLVLEQSALRDRIVEIPVRPALRWFRIGLCVRERSLANPLVAAIWQAE